MKIVFLMLTVFMVGGIIALPRLQQNNQSVIRSNDVVRTVAATASPTPNTLLEPGRTKQLTTERTDGGEDAGTVVEVTGKPFEFTPKKISVKRGEKLSVTFVNAQGTHDFVIDELNVRTKTLNAGQTETVQIPTNKPGTYTFYCSVGNHREMGMVGTLVVE